MMATVPADRVSSVVLVECDVEPKMLQVEHGGGGAGGSGVVRRSSCSHPAIYGPKSSARACRRNGPATEIAVRGVAKRKM